MKVHGRCHCGAITYEAEVQPGSAVVCHCKDCQTMTGTAFRTTIQAPAETFRLLSGTPRAYLKTADSGAKRIHAFCETCGSPVYSAAPENTKTYGLRLGALREAEALGPPAREIWTRRRMPWVDERNIPQVEGQP